MHLSAGEERTRHEAVDYIVDRFHLASIGFAPLLVILFILMRVSNPFMVGIYDSGLIDVYLPSFFVVIALSALLCLFITLKGGIRSHPTYRWSSALHS